MSVLICIPTAGEIDSRTAETALAICANHPGGADLRTVRAHPIDRCRNLCVSAFLQSPHSHLLFLDGDVVPPVDCLNAMLAASAPVVCGIYPLFLAEQLCTSVGIKADGGGNRFLTDLPDGPFEVDTGGLGCCLIAREVLELLDCPWFQFNVRDDLSMEGENIYFFEKCAKAGIRVLALPGVMCRHYRTADLLRLFLACRGGRHAPELGKAA